jgi:transcriptional regulator with XRE-family HTH domain
MMLMSLSRIGGERNVQVGSLLRGWRRRRRLSRAELARAAGVSGRELGHVETGRARPSRELLLALADGLGVPPRERAELLAAAGLPPPAEGPELATAREALERLLALVEPFPALAVDGRFTLVAANAALPLLTRDVAPALLEPPVNVVRLALHPAGMARHLPDLAHWRAYAEDRLRLLGAAGLADEVAGYPAPDGPAAPPPGGLRPLRLRTAYGTLSFLPALTRFPAAVAVSVAELALVTLHPVDARTRSAARAAASRPSGR